MRERKVKALWYDVLHLTVLQKGEGLMWLCVIDFGGEARELFALQARGQGVVGTTGEEFGMEKIFKWHG